MDGAKNDRMVGFLTVFTILSHGVAATNICTGSVRETPAPHHDVITSPSYPDRYPRGAPCSLKLSFPHGFFIVLNVTDYRLTSKYLGLRKDKLLIKYGVYKTINPSAGTMSVLPSNEVTMKFIRNLGGHQSSRGFSLAYTAAPFHTACHATEELVRINRILFIASRNYPEHYDERMDCRVTVKAPPRHFLRIKSYDFKVERTPRCTFDFLKIKDPKTNITILNKTCGHTSFGVTAWSRIVTVYFRTDGSRNSKGFLLFLEAIPKPTFHTIPQMTMIGAQQTTRITVTNDVTTSQLNETSPTKDTGTARNLVLSATTPLTINQNPRDVLQHFENNVTLVPLTEPYRTTPNDGGGHVKNQGKASIAGTVMGQYTNRVYVAHGYKLVGTQGHFTSNDISQSSPGTVSDFMRAPRGRGGGARTRPPIWRSGQKGPPLRDENSEKTRHKCVKHAQTRNSQWLSVFLVRPLFCYQKVHKVRNSSPPY